MKNQKEIIAYINHIIECSSSHSKTANHFYNLKRRLMTGKKLTKKMHENLSWIMRDVANENASAKTTSR